MLLPTNKAPNRQGLRSPVLLWPVLLVAVLILSSTVCADTKLNQVTPFLKQYCYACHGELKQEGDIRLDNLDNKLNSVTTLEIWQNVLDQLNLGEMPPAEEPQPPPAEAKDTIATLTSALSRAYEIAQSTGRHTVLRRLNRHELRNTFRDLLYLQGADYRPGATGSKLTDNNGNGSVERTGSDPLRFFPEDEEEDGFFNLGNQLVMSDFLLKLTLGAAEETLGQATHLGPRPDTSPLDFSGHLVTGRRNGEHPIETVSREFNPDFDMLAQGYERYGRLAPSDLRQGVGFSAEYQITVEVSAHNPKHPWQDMFTLEDSEPFQLCLNIADTGNRGIEGPTSTPLTLWNVPADGKRHNFTTSTWMDQGWIPWLGWENGQHDRSFRPEKIVETYFPDSYRPRPDKKADQVGHDKWPLEMTRVLFRNGYQGPHLRIHRLTLTPVIKSWPPQSHRALYGTGSGTATEIRQLMTRFANRAFRREVTPQEIEPYVQLVLQKNTDAVVQMQSGISDLKYEAYDGKWSKLPDFNTLQPFRSGKLPQGFIDINVAEKKDYYAVAFTGKLLTKTTGEHLIEMASDDGARIIIDGNTILEHDGLHGAAHRKQKVSLAPGEHTIRVEYLAYGQPNSFRAGWSGPGFGHHRLSIESLHAKQSAKKQESVPSLIRALQDGYTAILCSPQFLYLQEKPGPLSDYQVANRLSYFLWSSMPDATLFDLASAGKLRNPAELRRQVERMLQDPKAAAFTQHFASTWLRMDRLGKMPPSGGDYQFYKNLKVEPMFMKQVTTFFDNVLASNGRIEDFIDSDHTYMNSTLAKWIYKKEGVRGDQLRKVKLNDPRRGGIFTLPGVMTATANGVDTSPVIRGAWLLENVLGRPPNPPPPDVEPLPTDTREAKTIRQQLELHRKHEACNSCHVKIDPMGFAFENFDVVGRWRDNYKRSRTPIDTSTILSSGESIGDIVEFKQMLKRHRIQIVQCLTSKMLTYAIGRRLETLDRGEVDRIVTALGGEEAHLRDMVHEIVNSSLFLNN